MNEKEIREIEARAFTECYGKWREDPDYRGNNPCYGFAEDCMKLCIEVRRLQGIVEECEELKKA